MDNTITLVGNITRDPEYRVSQSGSGATSFGIAVNRRWQKDGEWQEQASFFDVSCFGALAEHVAESCAKGSRVMVSGRLEQQTWEKDGERKSKVHVVADDVGVSLRFTSLGAADVTENSEPF